MDKTDRKKALDAELAALEARSMKTLDYYDILTNDDGEVMFSIKRLGAKRDKKFAPVIYYDGGAHAILVKNEDLAVVCDHVHPGVRALLFGAKEVLIAELEDGSVAEEYMAEMRNLPGIERVAEKFVKPL